MGDISAPKSNTATAPTAQPAQNPEQNQPNATIGGRGVAANNDGARPPRFGLRSIGRAVVSGFTNFMARRRGMRLPSFSGSRNRGETPTPTIKVSSAQYDVDNRRNERPTSTAVRNMFIQERRDERPTSTAVRDMLEQHNGDASEPAQQNPDRPETNSDFLTMLRAANPRRFGIVNRLKSDTFAKSDVQKGGDTNVDDPVLEELESDSNAPPKTPNRPVSVLADLPKVSADKRKPENQTKSDEHIANILSSKHRNESNKIDDDI